MAEETTSAVVEMNTIRYDSFPKIFSKMRELSARYGSMPMDSLIDAFGTVSGRYNVLFSDNPYMQNRRVKGISTRPANYGKLEIQRFIESPEVNEQPLRAVFRSLEYISYPMAHIRRTYQNLLTYHSYVAPSLTDDGDAKDDAFWREWKLLEKLRKKLNPKDTCHMICGQALQAGKVFYVPRIRVDKSHNKVDYAFLQQLPSDYVKIVGFNNVSKYTVAFNMMYFMTPGTTPAQFGDLFDPFIDNFSDAIGVPPDGLGTKVVYAALNMDKVRAAADPRVEAYYQNGKWCYWVTLPVDKVFPFEIDDTDRNVLPIFVGLFLDILQLQAMNDIQLELLQNPLVSLLHGEIPYWDNKSDNTADDYKLSNAGRILFETLWYQMLQTNQTSGIGLYAAPFENMKLETLSEVPNATEIVSNGVKDLSVKTGLAAIIPASDDARAGAVNVSLMIESRLPETVYRCYERMVNALIDGLRLNYSFSFHMTGNLSEDEKRRKEIREELTLGIQANLLEYEALGDTSFLDDIAVSDVVIESGILDKRIPLISSFHQSATSAGRPPSEGITSDGQEQDADKN